MGYGLQFPQAPSVPTVQDLLQQNNALTQQQAQIAAARLANAKSQMDNQAQSRVQPSSIAAQIAEAHAAAEGAPLDVESKRAALTQAQYAAAHPLLAYLSRFGATSVAQNALAHLLPGMMPKGSLGSPTVPTTGGAKSLASAIQSQPVTTAQVGGDATTPAAHVASILAHATPGVGKMSPVTYGKGGIPQATPASGASPAITYGGSGTDPVSYNIGGMSPVTYGTSKASPAAPASVAQQFSQPQLTPQQNYQNELLAGVHTADAAKKAAVTKAKTYTNTVAFRNLPALGKLQVQSEMQKLGYGTNQSTAIINKGDSADVVTNSITPGELIGMNPNYYSASTRADSGLPQNLKQSLQAGRGSQTVTTPVLNADENARYEDTLSGIVKNTTPTQIISMRYKANTAVNQFNNLSSAIPYLKKYAGAAGSYQKVLDTLGATATGRATPEYQALVKFRKGAPIFINEFSSTLGAGKTDTENKQLQSTMADVNLGTMTPDQVVDNWNQIGDTLKSQQKVLAEKPSETLTNQPKVAVVPTTTPATPQQSSLAAPKIGTVEDGHRYKGGPPGDKNSWEPA